MKKFMRPCAIFLSVVMFFEYDGLRRMLFPCSWAFGCKLMLAGSAEILLIPIGIFAVTIK